MYTVQWFTASTLLPFLPSTGKNRLDGSDGSDNEFESFIRVFATNYVKFSRTVCHQLKAQLIFTRKNGPIAYKLVITISMNELLQLHIQHNNENIYTPNANEASKIKDIRTHTKEFTFCFELKTSPKV